MFVNGRFVVQEQTDMVKSLRKALYGLKQAPRVWYDLLSKFLLSQEFSKGTVDPTLFIRRQGKDILLCPRDTSQVEKSKLDEIHKGIAVDPKHHYRGIIGALMYLTASRPDLIFVVYMCAWYQAKPTEKHLHAVKRIFKYLQGTLNRDYVSKGIFYSPRLLDEVIWRFHFINEQVENGVIELYFVNTEY
ncbi:retrovirus-related pol polyprotein from transposon TNT 1-94 [Tanacetum coccineum]